MTCFTRFSGRSGVAVALSLPLLSAMMPSIAGAASFSIDAMEHDIQLITEKNFDGVIGKFRDTSVASLWFFKDDNSADKKLLDTYNDVAKDLKGMAKVTAINCNDWAGFCSKNNVKETPAVMIYPINPYPAFLHTGKMEAKAISHQVARLIPDFTTRVTQENFETFLGNDPSKPKVMLFSNKKAPPTILKALSSDTVFRRAAKFGFVTEGDKEVCQKYKVKSFPTIIMQRRVGTEVKKETYSGAINYADIHSWVNPYVESGMGDKKFASGGKEEATIEDDQPWLMQDVPEMTAKSANSICFKGDGLCVIYLKDGAITSGETEMLTRLSKKFISQISGRGATMKWMWINLGIETAFKELFAPAKLPSAVVFNPHKRLRFTQLDHGEENEIEGNEDTIAGLVDKVVGGDARFKPVPGQKLPAFQVREAPKPGATKKPEL